MFENEMEKRYTDTRTRTCTVVERDSICRCLAKRRYTGVGTHTVQVHTHTYRMNAYNENHIIFEEICWICENKAVNLFIYLLSSFLNPSHLLSCCMFRIRLCRFCMLSFCFCFGFSFARWCTVILLFNGRSTTIMLRESGAKRVI